MTTARLALIGAGVIGQRHLVALRACAGVELVGIADLFPSARAVADAQGVPFFETAALLLEATRPEGVIVATPTEHHLQPTLEALDAGAHVLVEKPIMATVAEAETAAARSAATGRHILVGHHRRYYGLVQRAREMLNSGVIGQLVAVSGQWNMRKHRDYYEPDWRKRWQAGPVLTNLIHDMDLLRHLVGDVTSISAETANSVLGFEKEDTAALILRFANGALGTFILSDQTHSPWGWEQATGENAAFPRSGRNAIRFMGTQGALEFPNLKLWRSNGDVADWKQQLFGEDLVDPLEDAFVNQIDHFTDVIGGHAAPRINAHDATSTLRATLAVYDAAREGKRVLLEDNAGND